MKKLLLLLTLSLVLNAQDFSKFKLVESTTSVLTNAEMSKIGKFERDLAKTFRDLRLQEELEDIALDGAIKFNKPFTEKDLKEKYPHIKFVTVLTSKKKGNTIATARFNLWDVLTLSKDANIQVIERGRKLFPNPAVKAGN